MPGTDLLWNTPEQTFPGTSLGTLFRCLEVEGVEAEDKGKGIKYCRAGLLGYWWRARSSFLQACGMLAKRARHELKLAFVSKYALVAS